MTDKVQEKLAFVCAAAMESSLYYQVLDSFYSYSPLSSIIFIMVKSFIASFFQKKGDRSVCNTHLAMNTFHTFHKLSDFFQLKVLDELIVSIESPALFLKRVKFYRMCSVSAIFVQLLYFPLQQIIIKIFPQFC